MNTLVRANWQALSQLEQIVEDLSDEYYAQEKIQGRSCAGSHIRHVIDHYRAFQVGLESGQIDYDRRHRDCHSAQDRYLALDKLLSLKNWLKYELPSKINYYCQSTRETSASDDTIDVKSETGFDESCPVIMPSTITRELCYLLNHTVHHSAYISLLIQQAGFATADHIGKAPATIISQKMASNA